MPEPVPSLAAAQPIATEPSSAAVAVTPPGAAGARVSRVIVTGADAMPNVTLPDRPRPPGRCRCRRRRDVREDGGRDVAELGAAAVDLVVREPRRVGATQESCGRWLVGVASAVTAVGDEACVGVEVDPVRRRGRGEIARRRRPRRRCRSRWFEVVAGRSLNLDVLHVTGRRPRWVDVDRRGARGRCDRRRSARHRTSRCHRSDPWGRT